jgi:anti-anti-sigma regulatory factor
MDTIAVWLKIDGDHLADAWQEAGQRLDNAENEVVLDFFSVRRIDPHGLKALEQLAARADEKAVKVVLCGVNVDIYKVLKLVKLAPRFTFLN